MEWYENESLWRELYPYLFAEERMAAAAEQVGQLLALTGVSGGAVLDLCCGPGRHSVELARRGFRVTGVDASEFLLEQARQRAGREGVSVEWVRGDMREFVRPAAFHLACNLFTSFGYFDREEDNLRVLANLYRSLAPGGALVMDMVGRERLQNSDLGPRYTNFSDGAVWTQQATPNQDWSRLDNVWTLSKGGMSHSYRFGHHLYSGAGLQERLEECGFIDVRLFGHLAGSPYGHDAARLVAVARKA